VAGLPQPAVNAALSSSLIISIVKMAMTWTRDRRWLPARPPRRRWPWGSDAQGMAMAKLKIATMLLLACSLVGGGAGLMAYQALTRNRFQQASRPGDELASPIAEQPKPAEEQPVLLDRTGDPLPSNPWPARHRALATGARFLAFLPDTTLLSVNMGNGGNESEGGTQRGQRDRANPTSRKLSACIAFPRMASS